MYDAVDEIGRIAWWSTANELRIEVDPPFASIQNKQDYETWLNEVMADTIEAIGSRKTISALQDYLTSVAQGRKAD
jgi:hypothetical protein